MQYGRALDRLVREFVISNPALGPVHVLKSDVSDGFYPIDLRRTDAPKLGLDFTSEVKNKELVAIPLTLIMGWKNLPPIFCMAMETMTDLENAALQCNTPALPRRLDAIVESIVRKEPPTLQPALLGLTRYP